MRHHPRAPIELKVEYKKMNTFFSDYTKNISKGGTFIKTAKPLAKGTVFLFKLSVPARESPFEVRGQVVWINDGTDSAQPGDEKGMGIEFLYDEDSQRAEFEGTVEALMRESLGDLLFEKLMARAHEEEA